MHSTFPIAKTKVQTWRPYPPGSSKDEEEEFPDFALRVESYNASEHFILVISPVNVKFVIPPRPQLIDKYNDSVKGGIQKGQFVTRRAMLVRDPVSLYTDDISHVDPELSNQDNIGSISGLRSFKQRSGRGLDRARASKYARVGEGIPRRFLEDDHADCMYEAFMLDVDELEYDQPMYLAASNSVIVKLAGEPDRDELLKYNHPIVLGHVKRHLSKQHGTETGIRYIWRPPFGEEKRALWINVLGKPVKIVPTDGVVGSPGLTVSIPGEKPLTVSPELLFKDTTAYGVFPTAEAAQNWMSPISRDAAKHKSEMEQIDRKSDSAVLTELQNQLKFYREDAEKRAKEHAEDLKRQREEYAAELKARDEELKRQRENEQAERQRKIDILKAAGAIAGIVLTFGLAVIKFVEKIAGK